MNNKHPEAEYWEDPKGGKHYDVDKAGAKMGDDVIPDEERRWQAGRAQRAYEADDEMAEGLLDAEVEETYERLKEKGLIPEGDTDEQGHSEFYTIVNTVVRHGNIPTKYWKQVNPEHSSPEKVARAERLEALYTALTVDAEEK